MPGMRVHELAKEFDMTSKELLERLREMKIPAKSHASVLADAYVAKIRKNLEPEIKQRSGKLAAKDAEALKKKQDASEKKKAQAEAERLAAREKELAAREEARAKREEKKTGVREYRGKPTEKQSGEKKSQSAPQRKTLADQIEEEQSRLDREAAEKKARERAEEMAADVKKKQAVDKALRSRTGRTAKAQTSSRQSRDDADQLVAEQDAQFSSLLSQIESEQTRIAEQSETSKAKKTSRKKAADTASSEKGAAKSRRSKKDDTDAQEIPDEVESSGEKNKPKAGVAKETKRGARSAKTEQDEKSPQTSKTQKGARSGRSAQRSRKSGRTTGSQYVPELEDSVESDGKDRYAQMAVQAEKLQRDKVLAEARAAVAAASNREGEGRRKKRKEKREAEARQRAESEAIERGLDPDKVLDESTIEVPQGVSVAKLAEILSVQPNDIIKRLFMLGQALTLTQSMSDELIELVADDMGRKVRVVSPEEEYAVVYNDAEEDLLPRPPVVTVMGHVDHGKTSLLDAIRHTGVVEHEAGGITQHIGASIAQIGDRRITFIDTPGHEAFTAMRARGAQVTDVIVLVVAADDGVMPQTIEAINHAKAADVPIVVAINKIDKPGAQADRVRQELVEYDVIPEEWGGNNMFVEVSAKQELHIDDLLETIILQADVLELKANPNAQASGFVIEANLDKGRGSVATVLVQRGTLHTGDVIVAGTSYGRVRALIDPHGEHVDEARPADPVEVLGLNSVPIAGDEFRVFDDERDARKLAEERALRERLAAQESHSHMNLDDLFSRIEEGKQNDLNLIVKADVQGSIEALRDAFEKMDQSEVRINIVHSAVGGITETDVTLAAASDAIIIGFNVRPTGKTRAQAEKERVDIRLYRIIYQAIEDINAARVGLLAPDIVEEDTGIAEIRETFKVPKVGTVAGCYVSEGEINRNDKVRIVRDGTVVFEGELASLRRFKEDVKSVKQGYECGIGIQGYQDLKIGDTIESYQVKEVERTE